MLDHIVCIMQGRITQSVMADAISVAVVQATVVVIIATIGLEIVTAVIGAGNL